MAAKDSDKSVKRSIALDGDKLGHVVGTVVALAVMALCFYVQKVDGFTAAVRVGWAFVIAYGATFFLVRVILRTTLREYVLHEREEKEKRSIRLRTSAEETEETQETEETETGEETS